jgi:hypothetical protein
MAKPDVFRILGCVVLVTLIIVIAVKMAQQCTTHASPSASSAASASSPVSAPAPAKGDSARGVCPAGFRPDQNGRCVENF